MAPAKQGELIDLRFPVGGLVKRYAYQNQPPYSCPDCLNVRPYDTFEGRERGGSRPGLLKSAALQLGAPSPVQMLCLLTTVSPAGAIANVLVAAANGTVYYRTVGGVMTSIAGAVNTTAPLLGAAQHFQKLYIADYRATRLKGTDGTIASANRLSATSVSDWTALGISTTLDFAFVMTDPYTTGTIAIVAGVVTLTGGTWPTWAAGRTLTVDGIQYTVNTRDSNTQLTLTVLTVNVAGPKTYSLGGPTEDDIYPISAVGVDYITLTGTLTNGTPRTWEIGRKIKVFDPTTNTMAALVPTYGIPPLNCPLICTYRERLVLAGPDAVWYMSRQGEAEDWDYGADPDDPSKPIAGTTEGDPIRALIPHANDYLLIGCENSIWAIRGDPGYGGQIEALSREIGIVGAGAWCQLPDASILFLSRDGLYLIPAGTSNYPLAFSREILPADLIDVDTVTYAVSMAYDSRGRGVHLYITPIAGTAGSHWWIDWATKTFWPVSVPAVQQPRCLASFAASATGQRNVIHGCHDGYLRHYGDTQTTDDSTAITSRVKYGPFPLGGSGYDGILTELAAVLDGSSGSVTWNIRTASTPEGAVASVTNNATGTWVAGQNRVKHARVRGVAAVLAIESTGRCAMESVQIGRERAGRVRC